ncbi:unnamed protein product, partial [marine sediment metagenome]
LHFDKEPLAPGPINHLVGVKGAGSPNVTITNVTAATAGKIYQVNLLYGEV